MPSLSTYIGFIPGALVIAFGVGVLEWIAGDMLREMDEMDDEQMWISWQNAKSKVVQGAQSFKNTYWAREKGFVLQI